MKRHVLTSLALAAALAAAPVSAGAAAGDDIPGAAWGFGAGSLAGAAVGGPPGLVAGGIIGAITGAATGAEADRVAAEARAEAAAQRSARLADELAEARTALADSGAAKAAGAPDALDGALALDVLFRTDSAALDARDRQRVARVARVLQRYPELQVTLTGHADRRGDDAYNETLSRQRAAAVRNALVAAGVAGERLALRARGERAATAPADDPDGLALDRRVSLELGDGRPGPEVASGR